MKLAVPAVLLFSLFASRQTFAQRKSTSESIKPITASVCEMLAHPAAFNNKIVKVRGRVTIEFEASTLRDDHCAGEIWFDMAAWINPDLTATTGGLGRSGSKGATGNKLPPIPVQLVRDAALERFERYLTESADTEANAGRPCGRDCHLYMITATFTGRIDGISNAIHAARLKRKPGDHPDRAGFGHMGLYEAQLIAGKVEDIQAEDQAHVGQPPKN
jgi:hypothetical protein